MFISIIEHIDALAAQHPDQLALENGLNKLSYSELVQLSQQIALQLQKAGVASGTRVGIQLPRSSLLVAGILGILRLGCSYVPLDPKHPLERTRHIVDQAELKYVLVQQTQVNLPAAICQIELKPTYAPLNGSLLNAEINPDDELYVIFTSGTTGRPKGVRVSHHNLMHLLTATKPLFEFNAEDRWSLFHSPCFDFSVWEIFCPLFHGACLVITPDEITHDSAAFYQFLIQKHISVLNQTPSSFYQLAGNAIAHSAESASTIDRPLVDLRYVIFGGEALSANKLKAWEELYPADTTRLINMYGITEITVHATFKALTSADIQQSGCCNIGSPLPGLSIQLLDEDKNRVADGEVGELYICGAGVSLGYHNNPTLNAERFLHLEDARGNYERAYKSGDLARKLSSGEFEYLGRKDRQVKIRGFRIELEEIESALLKQAQIQQCLVMAKEYEQGDVRLIAFLVAESAQQTQPDLSIIRQQLTQLLPDYMQPSAMHWIDRMPLNTNHKADTAALEQWLERHTASDSLIDCKNALELDLLELWATVLKNRSLQRSTQFYQAGGDSLLTARLLLEVQNRWGVTIKMRQLQEDFSIASMAGIIQGEH